MEHQHGSLMVDAEWLEARRGGDNIAVVDVRVPFLYAQAHLPGAVNLPHFFLAGPDAGPPEPAALAARLGAAGIGPDTEVVAYDDGASPQAARLVWVLHSIGHRRAAVLDGGITAWMHDERPMESGAVQPVPVDYPVPARDGSVIVDGEYVRTALGRPDLMIIDVRGPDEYLGLQQTGARNGHIPTAVNIEWSTNLRAGEDAVVRHQDPEELRALYASAGATPDKELIVYCQSGQRASAAYLTLRSLGYPQVRVYSPGWMEWGNRFDVPVEPE